MIKQIPHDDKAARGIGAFVGTSFNVLHLELGKLLDLTFVHLVIFRILELSVTITVSDVSSGRRVSDGRSGGRDSL